MITRILALALSVGAAAACFTGTADAAQVKSLHAFCSKTGCPDGAKPWAAPVTDGHGNWYGTSYNGGAADSGVVYQLSFNGTQWVTKRLHAFCTTDCRDGAHPRSSLIVGTDGSLYGTASEGGSAGWGTIFRMTPDGSGGFSFKVLHTFCTKSGCPDGARPAYQGLTYQGAASGALYDGTSPLYGTTVNGGTQSQGAAFELTPGATKWTHKVIHNFCSRTLCADGGQSYAPLTMDAMGHLYGVTTVGGSANHGTVFELSKTATKWKHTVLHDFCEAGGFCADGDAAEAQLTLDGHGDLIGTTYFGGAHAKGSVFKVTPSGAHSTFTTLYSFCATAGCPDGQNPQGAITLAGGRLIGTTYGGGSGNKGTVFKLAGANYATFTSLHSFGTTAKAGAYPTAGVVLDSDGNLFGTTVTGGANDLGLAFQIKP